MAFPMPLYELDLQRGGARTERERMLAGDLYHPSDPELTERRTRARRLLNLYNSTDQADQDARNALLGLLLGSQVDRAWIEPPFFCDYGDNLSLASNVFINANCVILDCARVSIGRNTLIGPAVQIYTGHHPIDGRTRATGAELAAPVIIGDDVWIGGGAIICPGVTIGEGSVIGAGSVVTHNIPANVVAVGNPCRVLRAIRHNERREAHHANGAL